jgi:mannose-6-phosphate isomerase-like protein (cupin superfamily)
MIGFHGDIEKETLENTNFRKVLFTGAHCQLVVMSLLPNEDIGMEVHANVDQFFRFEAGEGKAILDGEEVIFKANDVVIIPAGTNHNIINTSPTEPLKLYTIYSPANHPEGTIHATKAEAMAAEEHHE